MSDSGPSYSIVPKPSEEQLTERQLVDYRDRREAFHDWLLHFGKDPKKAEGYSPYTVGDTMYRTDLFWRWVWTENGGYTLAIAHEHADEYMKHLAMRDCSSSNKATSYRAVRRLMRYRSYELGDPEWEPEIKFSNPKLGNPRDFLTRRERRAIREAAMEYGTIPGYNDLSPDQRDRWKIHLAQRFQKPKRDVVPADWDRANGWKIPSLVWTGLDLGLRPVEIERAKVSWIDLRNERVVIPEEESSKNRDNWKTPISSRTTSALERWLEERSVYDKYDGKDDLWLTRDGNPYSSNSLSYLLNRLFEIAEIPTENRQVSWYMIRHSTGTYMSREEGLEAARQQLRHKSPETTMRYDQAPAKERREALDRMG